LKNKNKLYPCKKLSVFYNTCLKTFGSQLLHDISSLRVNDLTLILLTWRKW